MALSKGFEALAIQLEEAAAMMHGDVRKRLSDAVDAAHKGSGSYAYYLDHSGSGKSGKVVYAKNGDTMMAPYSLGATETGESAKVDVKNEKKVVPTVTYADPDGDNDAGAKESAVEITGDVIPLKEGAVGQDGSAYLKLIAPGRGSSGYYPESVLERDGPKVFAKGTRSFWNHQTDAEESARPEGDLRDLASVLTEDAHYEKSGPAGPGLYARAKVFEQFRQPVDDLAKHIGMSIRATGTAKEGTAPDGKKGPIIEKLTRGISVDYVTQPGAGGQVLQLFEAARRRETPPQPQTGGEPMTAAEQAIVTKLQESLAESKVTERRFRERFAMQDAAGVVQQYFSTVNVAEGIRKRVTERLLAGTVPLTEAGDLDKEKLTKLAEAETKDEAAYISSLAGGRIVTGMGAPQLTPLTEAQKTEAANLRETEMKRSASIRGIRTAEGRRIFLEGREAFDPEFNAADKKEVAEMAVNEVYLQGDTISMALPAGASAVASGDPIMFGTGTSPGYGLAGVCETSYTPPTGVATGNVAVRYKGVFAISVLGKDAVGGSNKAFAPGDKCYYSGGTYDATTGARYGGVLTNDAVNGAYFGNVLDIVAAGATTSVRVRLKVAG